MKQYLIVILDLGSTENTVFAREIRELGVYSEIHPHDISVEQLNQMQNVKGIILNGGKNRVVDGVPVDMPPKEYDLFFYLVKNRNIALSREKLLSDVWGYDFYGDERTLDTHIKLLRKSLGPYSGRIVTLRGVGYRFEG